MQLQVAFDNGLDLFSGIFALEFGKGIFKRLGTVAVFSVVVGIEAARTAGLHKMVKTLRIKKTVDPLMDILGPDPHQFFRMVGMRRNFHASKYR